MGNLILTKSRLKDSLMRLFSFLCLVWRDVFAENYDLILVRVWIKIFVGSNFDQFFVVIVDVRFVPLRNPWGFIYSFQPFILFSKVNIASIILNFSF